MYLRTLKEVDEMLSKGAIYGGGVSFECDSRPPPTITNIITERRFYDMPPRKSRLKTSYRTYYDPILPLICKIPICYENHHK